MPKQRVTCELCKSQVLKSKRFSQYGMQFCSMKCCLEVCRPITMAKEKEADKVRKSSTTPFGGGWGHSY